MFDRRKGNEAKIPAVGYKPQTFAYARKTIKVSKDGVLTSTTTRKDGPDRRVQNKTPKKK